MVRGRVVVKNIPPIKCMMREKYAYDMDTSKTGCIEGYIHAVTSIRNKALLFMFLARNGAMFARLPISAFCTNPTEEQDLGMLQLWDSLSYEIDVVQLDMIKHMSVEVFMKDKKWYPGQYLFTVDYFGSATFAETPDEHKQAHVIKLDNGNFAIQPNNRLRWRDASICDTPFNEKPDYKVMTHEFFCENGEKWVAADEYLY